MSDEESVFIKRPLKKNRRRCLSCNNQVVVSNDTPMALMPIHLWRWRSIAAMINFVNIQGYVHPWCTKNIGEDYFINTPEPTEEVEINESV